MKDSLHNFSSVGWGTVAGIALAVGMTACTPEPAHASNLEDYTYKKIVSAVLDKTLTTAVPEPKAKKPKAKQSAASFCAKYLDDVALVYHLGAVTVENYGERGANSLARVMLQSDYGKYVWYGVEQLAKDLAKGESFQDSQRNLIVNFCK